MLRLLLRGSKTATAPVIAAIRASTCQMRVSKPSAPMLSAQISSASLRMKHFYSTSTKPDASESFVNGTNGVMLEQLYENWVRDPLSVHSSWARFFERVDAGAEPGEAVGLIRPSMVQELTGGASLDSSQVNKAIFDTVRLITLMRMFRVRGHLAARTDPLGLKPIPSLADLQPESYGFTEADYDREMILPPFHGLREQQNFERITIRKVIEQFRANYCGAVGIEYYHLHDPVQRDWLQRKIEVPETPLTKDEKKLIFTHLQQAETFEQFLATKFVGVKRFGVEGAESLLPAVEAIVAKASDLGIESTVIGMPHRGRLNILANVMKKNLAAIMQGFTGADHSTVQGSGDVKYHLGTACERKLVNGKMMDIALCPNPSHLEAVDPVVEGRTRIQQFFMGDKERKRAMSLLMHGDAAFAGQGVVAESLSFSDLRFFRTGGTIHVIVNNQIGFTTDPSHARSSPYPSDFAKGIGAPIFHVNGDDVEAVVRVARLAVEWRQKFGKSVVVDIVCYRRHGHNESDEPAFTQPRMYEKIRQQPTTLTQYRQKLINEGSFTEEELNAIKEEYLAVLNQALQDAKTYAHTEEDWLESRWKELRAEKQESFSTGISEQALAEIGKALTTLPEGFTLHSTLNNGFMKARRKMVEEGKGIDWGMGEAYAFASLLRGDGLKNGEGISVRLSGQDVERGTFSHRHSVLHDIKTYEKYLPLDNLSPKQQRFNVANSNLSEYAVLGFEYGTSLENPYHYAVWEAQFGDFANGAQIIFDQFLSSAEAKWYVQSGLVCLLPHGYDGQGPEHSSCRIERFLQSVDEDPELEMSNWNMDSQLRSANWQVVLPSNAANYFHVLRRQVCRNYRKPLIIPSPKRLLRLREASCEISQFVEGTSFRPVIPESFPEQLLPDNQIKRVVFCSGQVYYDLVAARAKADIKNIAIVRVEQIAPFPFAEVREQALRYPKAHLLWAQEEPKNMGAWSFVRPRFETALQTETCPLYAGRRTAASPATGWSDKHKKELSELLRDALTLSTH